MAPSGNERRSSLVESELGVTSFYMPPAGFWISCLFSKGRDGQRNWKGIESKESEHGFPSLIRMRVSRRIRFHSQRCYTPRSKAVTEKLPRVCRAPSSSQSCRETALTPAYNPPHFPPLPLLFPPSLIMHADFKI